MFFCSVCMLKRDGDVYVGMSPREVDVNYCVGEVETLCLHYLLWLKSKISTSHAQMNTHICLHKHRQGYWATVGISSDPWLGSHCALLVEVSVTRPTGRDSLWAHSEHTREVFLWRCLFASVLICGGSERREVEDSRRKDRERNQSWVAAKKEKGKAPTREYSSFLFLSVSNPSLTRLHMVVRAMTTERWSQSLAS